MNETPPPVYLAPDRYVTVGVYATISGRTQNSIRMKIRDGKWLEKREFIRDPDGTVLSTAKASSGGRCANFELLSPDCHRAQKEKSPLPIWKQAFYI
ncbi:hypothetical protein [Variovorax sp. IB41]|uniref:hypothetical protein n=1 Tax=Variovorax sp. IB41 TaxID=2779370 RepID=UPI001E5F7273|nr:hypothetical protein [Variovorax sp. IB41]